MIFWFYFAAFPLMRKFIVFIRFLSLDFPKLCWVFLTLFFSSSLYVKCICAIFRNKQLNTIGVILVIDDNEKLEMVFDFDEIKFQRATNRRHNHNSQ